MVTCHWLIALLMIYTLHRRACGLAQFTKTLFNFIIHNIWKIVELSVCIVQLFTIALILVCEETSMTHPAGCDCVNQTSDHTTEL